MKKLTTIIAPNPIERYHAICSANDNSSPANVFTSNTPPAPTMLAHAPHRFARRHNTPHQKETPINAVTFQKNWRISATLSNANVIRIPPATTPNDAHRLTFI